MCRWLKANMRGAREGSGPGTHTQNDPRGPDPEPGRGSNALYQEEPRGDKIRRRAKENVRYGKELVIGSLNVRSLWKPAMHKQVVDYMEEKC